jgi:hypothetical protein
VLNRVNGAVYPRYEFSNASPDILSIYCRALERVGVVWRRMGERTISVARRSDVARLDEIVGPKA